MSKIHIAYVAWLLILTSLNQCSAELIGYKFTGHVKFLSPIGPPYGLNISNNAAVTGRFIIDMDSSATDDLSDCDCTGYRQHRVEGLFSSIGDVVIRADDYIVEVLNDKQQPSGVKDLVTIQHRSNLQPPLLSQLIVNGIARSQGRFTINIVGPSNLLSDSSLPESLDLTNYTSEDNIFSDRPNDIDLFFRLTELQSFTIEVGDYDFDSDVDDDDYVVWKESFGSGLDLAADGNRDGMIDAADYVVWRKIQNAQSSSMAPQPAASPEPENLAVYVLLAAGAVLRRIAKR